MSGSSEVKGKTRKNSKNKQTDKDDTFKYKKQISDDSKTINYDYTNCLNMINSTKDLFVFNSNNKNISNMGKVLNDNLSTINGNNVNNSSLKNYCNLEIVSNPYNNKIKSEVSLLKNKLIKIPIEDEKFEMLNSQRKKSSIKQEESLIFKIVKDHRRLKRKVKNKFLSSLSSRTYSLISYHENIGNIQENKSNKLNSTNLINNQFFNSNMNPYINIVNINIDNKNCKSSPNEKVLIKNKSTDLYTNDKVTIGQNEFNNFNSLNNAGNNSNLTNENIFHNKMLKILLDNQARKVGFNNFLNCSNNTTTTTTYNNYSKNYNQYQARFNNANSNYSQSLSQNINEIKPIQNPVNPLSQYVNHIEDSSSKFNFNNNVFDLNFDNLLNETFKNKQDFFKSELDSLHNINDYNDFFKND
jgi:hypothetical protein